MMINKWVYFTHVNQSSLLHFICMKVAVENFRFQQLKDQENLLLYKEYVLNLTKYWYITLEFNKDYARRLVHSTSSFHPFRMLWSALMVQLHNDLCALNTTIYCVKLTHFQVLNKLQNYHTCVCVISTPYFLQCMLTHSWNYVESLVTHLIH